MPPHPLDDDDPEETPANATNRVRRPWWRWHVVTLLVALFLLVWVREFGKLGPSLTWSLMLSIFIAWSVLPTFFVTPKFASLPVSSQPARLTRAEAWRARNRHLIFLKGLAAVGVVLGGVGLASMAFFLLTEGFGVRMGWPSNSGWMVLMQLNQLLLPYLTCIVASAGLFALAEIGLRLDPEYSARFDPPSRQVD